MSIFNKISMEYIKKSRTRTITTILGIILSAAMICGVMIFVSSYRYYEFINYNRYVIDYEPEPFEFFSGSFYEFDISFIADFEEIFIPTAVIMLTVIIVSGFMIYNSFYLSIGERTKQLGLIASVGATGKQLRKMVLTEALMISAIGIPVGILLGMGIMAVLLKLIGHWFINFAASLPLVLYIEPLGIITSCVIAFLVVIISSLAASKKALKISVINAVRDSGYSQNDGRKIKTSRFMSKNFGIAGMLADRHYKSNHKRSKNIVAGLCMSLVVIVTVCTCSGYLIQSVYNNTYYNPYDYEIRWFGHWEEYEDKNPDEVLDKMLTAEGISDGSYFRFSREKAFINGELKDVKIIFIDDESYKQMLEENNLSPEKYMKSDEPLAVAVDGFADMNPDTYRVNLLASDSGNLQILRVPEKEGCSYNDIYVDENGQEICWYRTEAEDMEDIKIPLAEAGAEKFTVKYGAVLDAESIPWCTGESDRLYYDGVELLYPYSFMEKVLWQGLITGEYIQYLFQSDTHAESTAELERIRDELGMTGIISDEELSGEMGDNRIAVIKVFAYGFSVLIFLLSAVNMFNIIYGNIRMRRREYAVLKSLGMSVKDFNKMISLECLTYGIKALLYGIPVSSLIACIMGPVMIEYYDAGLYQNLYFPWKVLLIAVLSVLIMVFAAMTYSIYIFSSNIKYSFTKFNKML